MNHKETLMQLSLETLIKISENLKISLFRDAKRTWIADTIARYYEDIRNFKNLNKKIGEETLFDLVMYACTDKPVNEKDGQTFSELGIMVQQFLPDDLKIRIQNWIRPTFIRKFPDKKIHVRHSYLLQLILVLNLFKKEDRIKLI